MRSPTWSKVRNAALDALAVLLPIECAGCGIADRAICDACRACLEPVVTERVVGERVVGGPGRAGLRVWSGLDYDGVVREVILALKTRQRADASWWLAPALAAAVGTATAHVGGALELAVVPGTRAAYRRRGYDPIRLVLGRAGLAAPRTFAVARPHEAQKGLAVDARGRNLRGVFRVRTPVVGRRILLIDDVVTTGSTLREAVRVLSDGGAEVVGAVVIASTRRRVGVGE